MSQESQAAVMTSKPSAEPTAEPAHAPFALPLAWRLAVEVDDKHFMLVATRPNKYAALGPDYQHAHRHTASVGYDGSWAWAIALARLLDVVRGHERGFALDDRIAAKLAAELQASGASTAEICAQLRERGFALLAHELEAKEGTDR